MYTHFRVASYNPVTSDFVHHPIDPRTRLDTFMAALEKARALFAGDGEEVLRIFVAPEWYFRTNRPYTVDEKHMVMDELRARSTEEPFRHWLILGGSITWGHPVGTRIVEDPEFHWYNTVPIVWNNWITHYHKQHDQDDFPGDPPRYHKVWYDSVPTGWDGADVGRHYHAHREPGDRRPRYYRKHWIVKPCVLQGEEGHEGANAFDRWRANPGDDPPPAMRRQPNAKSCFFTIDGLQFCVEICADYTAGTAVRAYREHNDGVDIHLVLSSGIPPDTPENECSMSLACVGGYLAMCNSTNSRQPDLSSAIYQVDDRQDRIGCSGTGTKRTPQQAERHDFGQDYLFAYHDLFQIPVRSIEARLLGVPEFGGA